MMDNIEATTLEQQNTPDKKSLWDSQLTVSDMSVDKTMPVKGSQDFIATILNNNGDVERTLNSAQDKNLSLSLIGEEEFSERFGSKFKNPSEVYKQYKSVFDIYNTYRKEAPVSSTITSTPFNGKVAVGNSMKRIVTNQQVAEMKNYLKTNDDKYAPLEKFPEYNYLKLGVADDGTSMWEEAKDNELIQAQQMRSWQGPKELESKFLGSTGRGLWSGGVPMFIKGIAGGIGIVGGLADAVTGDSIKADVNKGYYKAFTALNNYANYLTHSNEDEDKSMFEDGNASVYQISNGITQLTGIMLTSGFSAIGLKSLGAIGVKMGDKAIMKIGVQVAMTVGALEAADPIYEELIHAGFTASEAALPAAIAGGITYASERVLGFNYAQKIGASFALNKYASLVGKKQVRKILRNETGKSFIKAGVKSAKDLGEDQKGKVVANVIRTFAENRKQMMYEMLDNINLKKVAISSLEEGFEEYIEQFGHIGLNKVLNIHNLAKAKLLLTENNNFSWDPTPVGTWLVEDKRSGEIIEVSNEYKDQYDNILGIAETVLSKEHELNEKWNWDEGVAAAASTFITMGIGSATGIINNKEIKQKAVDLAIYLHKNPEKIAEYEKNLNDVIKEATEIDQNIMKAVDQDARRYMLLLDKYGLESETFKAVKLIDGAQDEDGNAVSKKISRELISAYDAYESLEKLSKEAAEDETVLKKDKRFKTKEDLKVAIENAQKRISYLKDKKNVELIDKDGKTFEGNYSQAFSDYYNIEASYTFAKKNYLTALATEAASGASIVRTEDEDESEYDKKYNETYNRAEALIDIDIAEKEGAEKSELTNLLGGIHSIYQNAGKNMFNYKLAKDGKAIWDSGRADFYSQTNLSSTIAARFVESLGIALNAKYNADINEDYNITKLKTLNEGLTEFVSSIEGKGYEDIASLLGAGIKGSNAKYYEALLGEMDDIHSGLQNVSKSSFQDPLLANEIDTLLSNAQAIYNTLPEGSSESANIEMFDDEGMAIPIEGRAQVALEDLSDEEQEALKLDALKISFENIVVDNAGISQILNKLRSIINENKPIPESQVIALSARINDIKKIASQYEDYLANQEYFKNTEKDNALKEHSAFALDRRLELNNDQKIAGEEYIADTKELLENISNRIYEAFSSIQIRAARTKAQHLDVKLQLFTEIINRQSELIDKERLKDANKVFNKLNDIHSFIKKKLGDKTPISVFTDLFSLYENADRTNEAELNELTKQMNEAHRILIELNDAFGDGGLTEVLSDIKDRFGEMHLTRNPVFSKGNVIDYLAKDLGGYFSANTITKGFDILFNQPGSIVQNSENEVGLVQYMASTILTRINNYGKEDTSSYREILDAYSIVINERLNLLIDGFEDTVYTSSYEQYEVVAHIVGFLQNFGGTDKASTKDLTQFIDNVLNVRGYAGAGKTQQVLYEALAVYQKLGKGEKLNVKYVAPTIELIDTFRKSVKSLSTDDEINIDDEVKTNKSKINLTTIALDDYFENGNKDDGEFDLIIVDEATVISKIFYKNDNGEAKFVDNIRSNSQVPYVLVSDDSQVGDKDMVSSINIYDGMFEKTIPLVEVYRTDLSLFKDYQKFIRDNRIARKNFELMNMTYFIGENGIPEGGMYVKNEKEIVKEFLDYVTVVKDGAKIEDAVLIVFDEAHRQKLLDDKANEGLANYEHLIRTTVWENNKRIVSGLSSNAVFIAINKANNYVETSHPEYQTDYMPRIMLTAISRAKRYLVMIGDGKVVSTEATKALPKEDVLGTEGESQSEFLLMTGKLSGLRNELSYLANLKKKETPTGPKDKVETLQTDQRKGRLFGKSYNKTRSSLVSDFFKKRFNEAKAMANLKNVSKLAFEAAELEDQKNELNRSRNEMLDKAARAKATNAFEVSNLQEQGEKVLRAHEDDKILPKITPSIKAYYENNDDIINEEKQPERIRRIARQLMAIELPQAFYDDKANILSPDALIFNNKIKGRPLALRITGWTGKGKNRKPIVDILDVAFTDSSDVTDYHKFKYSAYAKILMDNGILVNQVIVSINQIAPAEGWSFSKTNEISYTLEELVTGLTLNDELFGDKKQYSSVPLETLYENERTVSFDKYKKGEAVSLKDDDTSYTIAEMTGEFNGTQMMYNLYLSQKEDDDYIIFSGTLNEINEKVSKRLAQKGQTFEQNALDFVIVDGKTESTNTSYFPYYDDIKAEINTENPYKKEKGNIAQQRRAVIDLARSEGITSFIFKYHKSFDITNLTDFTAQPLSHVLTIELNPAEIDFFVKKLKTKNNGLTKTIFIKKGLHILGLANFPDRTFKDEFNQPKPLFENSSNNTVRKEAQDILDEFTPMSFIDFKNKFKTKLDNIFKTAFENDRSETELIEYNTYKLYRIVLVKNQTSKTLPGNFKSRVVGAKDNITQTQPIFNSIDDGNTMVKDFNDTVKEDGFEIERVEPSATGITVIYKNKVHDQEVSVFFYPDKINANDPEDIYIGTLIDELESKRGQIAAILKDNTNDNKYLEILEIIKSTEAFEFIYSNKSRLYNTINGARIFKSGLNNNLTFKEFVEKKPERLVIKGNMQEMLGNALSALNKINELARVEMIYKATNLPMEGKSLTPDKLAVNNGGYGVKGIANPYLNIFPIANSPYDNNNSETTSVKKTGDRKGRRKDVNIYNTFDLTANYPWRNNATFDLSDNVEVVRTAINDILGDLGLDVTTFVPNIDGAEILGNITPLKIKLLAKGDKASVKVARHEAMHFIMKHLITPQTEATLLTEAKMEMLKKGYDVDLSETNIQEWIADMFMEGDYKKLDNRSVIKQFIDWIKRFFNIVDEHKDTLYSVMSSADVGYYKDAAIKAESEFSYNAKIENAYTTIAQARNIEKYFGKLKFAQEVAEDFILRPALLGYTFLSNNIADENDNYYQAIIYHIETSSKFFLTTQLDDIKKNGLDYNYVEDGKIKKGNMSYADIISGKGTASFMKAIDAVTNDGEYLASRNNFLAKYMSVVSYQMNDKGDVSTEGLNALVQSVSAGIDFESIKLNSDGKNKTVAISSTYIFKNPNTDSSDQNPGDMFSSLYEIYLSSIPYIHEGDSTQKRRGFVNGKLLNLQLMRAASAVINSGNSYPTFEEILVALERIGKYGDLTTRNTIHSFFRAYDGTVNTNSAYQIFKEKFDNEDYDSMQTSFIDNGQDEQLGIRTLLSPEFAEFRETESQDEDILEVVNAIDDTIRKFDQFIMGLTQKLISTVPAPMAKVELKGKNMSVKQMTHASAAIDRVEMKNSIDNSFINSETKQIKSKAKKYINDNKAIFKGKSFLEKKGEGYTSENLLVEILAETLGINISDGIAKHLLSKPQLKQNLKSMFSDMIDFAKNEGEPGKLNVFDPTARYSRVIDFLAESSLYSNDMRFAEMVRTVENKLAYSNTLGNFFLSRALGPAMSKDFSLSERIIKNIEDEISGEFSPLNSTTSPILSRKMDIINMFFFNGIDKGIKMGKRIDKLNSRDKFVMMKTILFDAIQNDSNKYYAFMDTMADKIRTPLLEFDLGKTPSKNIFVYNNYNLSMNENNLYEVLKDFHEYDKAVAQSNVKRFKGITGSKKVEAIDPKSTIGKRIKQKLIKGQEYHIIEGKYLPITDSGYDVNSTSMEAFRKSHSKMLSKFAKNIKNHFSNDEELNELFKMFDYTSFDKIAGVSPRAAELFKEIKKEDIFIADQIARNKAAGYYDKEKSYLDKKKTLVSELKGIIVDNDFQYSEKGVVHLMPVLEMMYWSHYIANKSMAGIMRGSELQTDGIIDYVKRAAGIIAPGPLLINKNYNAMPEKINTLTLNDIKDAHKLFSKKELEASDGISTLPPLFQEMTRRMNGGDISNVSRGSLKTMYYYYDINDNRVTYQKMNQFAIGEMEYLNSPLFKSIADAGFGGIGHPVHNVFTENYEATKDFNKAVSAAVDFLEKDGNQYKDDMLHFATFGSAVKQGKVNTMPLNDAESVSTATMEGIDIKPYINKLDRRGYRLQQITVQDTFNSKTSVPSQIMNVVSVLSHNETTANNIEKALSYFSSDIRDQLMDVMKSEDKGFTPKQKRERLIREIILEYALQSQSNEKTIELMSEEDVDFDVFREKIIEILSSKVKKGMNGSMPGAYHIQGVFFGDIYVNDLGQIKMFQELTAEDEGVFKPRELNPQGYVREDGSFIEDAKELESITDTTDIDDRYKKLFDEQNLIINSTIVLPEAKVEKAKAKLIKLELSKADEISKLEKEKPNFKFRKAEVIMPFIYAFKFGVKKGMTLNKSFEFGNANLYSPSGEITFEEILSQIKSALPNDNIKTSDLAEIMPASIYNAFIQFSSALIKSNNQTLEAIVKKKGDIKDLKVQDIKKMGKKELSNRLATFYLNFNRSLDVFSVRIPTTGASMGSPGRLVAFSWGVENTAYLSPKKNLLDGSDYDADQLNIFFRAIDQFSKIVDSETFSKEKVGEEKTSAYKRNEVKIENRNPLEYNQNLIFNAIEMYYDNVANKDYVLQRIDLDSMREAAKDKEENSYYDFDSFLASHETNAVGRRIVGHFANLGTFINNISRSGRNKGISDYLSTITNIFDEKQPELFLKVTDVIIKLVNAATDNANEGGLLGRLNITEESSPLVAGFVFTYNKKLAEGNTKITTDPDLEKALYAMLEHPIVKQIINTTKSKNSYTNDYSTSPVSVIMNLEPSEETIAALTKEELDDYNLLIEEVKEYAKVGEQLKRMGMAIQAYRDPGSSMQDIHAKIFDVEFAIGDSLYEGYINKLDNKKATDVFTEYDFSIADQVAYVSENLKTGINLSYETAIRSVLNIPFILSALGNVNSQLKTISAYEGFVNQLFKVSSIRIGDSFGLDAIETEITHKKGNRDVDSLEAYYRSYDKAMIGLYLDTFTDAKLTIDGKIIKYDLSKINANDNGRLQYVQDFVNYFKSLKRGNEYQGNSFFQSLRILNDEGYKAIHIENLSAQSPNVLRKLRTGFRLLKEEDKDAFRAYQLIVNGFYNYRGSMNSVMDTEAETGYSEFINDKFPKLTESEKIKILTNVVHESGFGVNTSHTNFDFTKIAGSNYIQGYKVKDSVDAEIISLDRIGTKLWAPIILRKLTLPKEVIDDEGTIIDIKRYAVSTIDYGSPFNIHSLSSETAFNGKVYNKPSFSDIEDLLINKKLVLKGNDFKFLGVASASSVRTDAMPVSGDIVILRDGSKATVKYDKLDNDNYTVTIEPILEQKSDLIIEDNRTTIKKVEFIIKKIKDAFPNIDIRIINDPSAPIGKVVNGIVYLNEAKIQFDTPIHEIGHIFINLLKKSNPVQYKTIIQEAEKLLLNNNKIALAVQKKYPNLSREDLLEEILATVMGLNSVSKVKEVLAKENIDQSNAPWIYKQVQHIIRKVNNLINRIMASVFKTNSLGIDQDMSIVELGDALFQGIINGDVQETVTSEELAVLMPTEKLSKELGSITSLSENDLALAKNNISDKGNEDIMISRLQQKIASNDMILPEQYTGSEIEFFGDIYSAENVEKVKGIISKQKDNKIKKMRTFMRFLNDFHANKDSIKDVFGSKENKLTHEIESIYDEALIMKLVNAVKYDGYTKAKLYSDLKDDNEYGYLYNPNLELDDYIVFITKVKDKHTIQFYSYYNYKISSFDNYAKDIQILDNFISQKEALRARLKMNNTQRTRISLNMALTRNYFHSVGAQVIDMGIIEHTKRTAQFDAIDQVKYTDRVKKMGKIDTYSETLSDDMKVLFDDKINFNDYVSYYDVLISFYTRANSGRNDDQYLQNIIDLNHKGESGVATMIKMLKFRLNYLQDKNQSHDPKNYTNYQLRELEFLMNSIYELEFMSNVTRVEKSSMSYGRRWFGSIDMIGDENVKRIKNTLRRTDGIIVKEYLSKMEKFRGTEKTDGMFQWFDKRHGNRLLSYGANISDNMFADLFVVVKDAKGNNVNTGHIFWTTDDTLDPLYAKLAREKLRSNPDFQQILDRGKIIVDHIENTLAEHILFNRMKTKIATKKDDELVLFTKEDALAELKKTSFIKGRMPIMTKQASSFLSAGNIGKAVKKTWEQMSSLSDIYDDIPFNSVDEETEMNVIQDIFINNMGVYSREKSNYGNVKKLEETLGYTVTGGEIHIIDMDKNYGMMKDLETLMNYFTMSIIRKNHYEQSVMPLFNAVHTLLLDEQTNRDINNKYLLEFLTDYKRQAVHNRKKETGTKEKPSEFLGLNVDKTASFAMRAASGLVMTANFNIAILSATANAAYSYVEAISNSISKMAGIEVFGPNLSNLVSSSTDFFTNHNLVRQLAYEYRAYSSEDYEMVQHRMHQKTKRHIFSNFYQNLLNWATDVFARSTSMVAVMKTDGTYWAHTYNKETGRSKYNPLEDRRFFKDGKLTAPGRVLAEALRQRLVRDGLQNDAEAITVDGVIMPTMAYSLIEGTKFKAYANRFIVGNYDNKAAATIGNTLLGAMFVMYKRFGESRINNAIIGRSTVQGYTSYIAREYVDENGDTIYVPEVVELEIEGYLRSMMTYLNGSIKARDLNYWSKLDNLEKSNVIKGATNLAMYGFMFMIYNLLVSQDWSEDEKDKPIPPLRMAKNIEYTYQSLLVIPLLIEMFKNPFAVVDIITGIFVDAYGEPRLKLPFKSQAEAFEEVGSLFSGQEPRQVQKDKEKAAAKERAAKRKEDELNKNN